MEIHQFGCNYLILSQNQYLYPIGIAPPCVGAPSGIAAPCVAAPNGMAPLRAGAVSEYGAESGIADDGCTVTIGSLLLWFADDPGCRTMTVGGSFTRLPDMLNTVCGHIHRFSTH